LETADPSPTVAESHHLPFTPARSEWMAKGKVVRHWFFERLTLALCVLLLVAPNIVKAQTEPAAQELQVRVGASLSKKVIRKVHLFVDPEMRTDGLNPDRYLIEGGLRYKPIKYFAAKGAFRTDWRETNE